VKAAPEWSSTALADFQVLREEGDFDGVIVHCFDAQKLVLALVTRSALEDYFGLPRSDADRRPTITQCVMIVSDNIKVFSEIISQK
jgi:hypothetical protein